MHEVVVIMYFDLKRTIFLNYLSYYSLLKDYLKVCVQSWYSGIGDKQKRRELLLYLNEYQENFIIENDYIDFISRNLKGMNENELNKIMDKIDELNKKTLLYYDSILHQYEVDMTLGMTRGIMPKKDFLHFNQNEQLYNEIIGLTLSKKDLYRYYENIEDFNYVIAKTTFLDIDTEKGMPFFGCYPKIEDGIITDIKIYVPEIYNLKSMLINIHEFNHGLLLYLYINKEYPNFDFEKYAKDEETKFIKSYVKQIKMS